ncbi:flavin reductase family protein [Pseudophaeobacter sp.]|uniref:flavin reductase family protein n=1 Tax=Pseudophaeobacter sp. TaxID=1971739 RepID=UPI004059C1AF
MNATSSVERSEFIAAMRQVASSVTVVTTNGPAGQAGATVSAFSSLSADPPSVLICLRGDSRIARTVSENHTFCVNLLPEHAQDLAQKFASAKDQTRNIRFRDMALTNTPSGPVLPEATGFVCRVENIMDHGTHRIFIGNVSAIHATTLRPLTYMDGRFHTVHAHHIPTGGSQCP